MNRRAFFGTGLAALVAGLFRPRVADRQRDRATLRMIAYAHTAHTKVPNLPRRDRRRLARDLARQQHRKEQAAA